MAQMGISLHARYLNPPLNLELDIGSPVVLSTMRMNM